MSTIDYSRPDPFAATRPRTVARVAAWLVNAFQAWKNRREFYRLGELSDVELHDIGLTRGDLAVPSDFSFTSDPTSALSRVARQRINRMEIAARNVC